MYTSFSTLAVLGLAAVANAHMIMNTPAPFSSGLNNSPLADDGSDFPCKQRGSATYAITGSRTTMATGSTQPLKFTGSAVHGGGSCQISITYDKEPTKDSVFKVIYSIEGGCPAAGQAGNVPGNDPNQASPTDYTFPVPDLPAGDATLAWTWFNKVGNREMYMNCAPITIGSGTAKRDGNATMLMERDQATFDALPNMLVANIATASCKAAEGSDLGFPNPGTAVTKMGSGTVSTISGCAGAVATGGSSSGGASSAQVSSPAATGTPKASSSASPSASKASSLPGGVFATVAPSAPTVTSSPASPSVSSSPSPVASKTGSASVPAATGTTGSGAALSGACTTEGQWNCIGGTSFQQCASGAWSTAQAMAAGMSCTAGQSASLSMKAISVAGAKRAIRFSEEHAARLARI